MAPVAQLSKADMCLFLQQLQANPPDIAVWDPTMRLSLLRGGLVDLTIYGRRVASTPRFALMAISTNALAYIAKHPCIPAINFTFDVPAARTQAKKGQVELVLRREKMSDAQIKVHEAALVSIAQWLTSLCTPAPKALVGASPAIETCIRFICAHTLGMPQYVHHLTDKFIMQAGKLALSSHHVTELVKSCRGEDDALLVGLAGKLVEKRMSGQVAAQQLDAFLNADGNRMLREKVDGLERHLGIKIQAEKLKEVVGNMVQALSKKREIGSVDEMEGADKMDVDIGSGVIGVDADGWQVSPDGIPKKKQKVGHGQLP
ncbi:hypothetical protein BDW02DRAFT_380565 [Decorospora gaudefroyi]|uniref:Uncharacterized protein n=1 Tax=Decorospora gaudefroyi TaxID=184978 RepID=A0A6A5KEA2_9PLEO|nr:hypothetical protein BDW02DRAFT_380565 [Decorospora gaudefroyi]